MQSEPRSQYLGLCFISCGSSGTLLGLATQAAWVLNSPHYNPLESLLTQIAGSTPRFDFVGLGQWLIMCISNTVPSDANAGWDHTENLHCRAVGFTLCACWNHVGKNLKILRVGSTLELLYSWPWVWLGFFNLIFLSKDIAYLENLPQVPQTFEKIVQSNCVGIILKLFYSHYNV